jgi:hypothetical protein
MRTSVLSRSVVAAIALAVGSAALTVAPATAATPSGITRETVIAAASGMRAAYSSADDPSPSTVAAIRTIINRSCNVDFDGGEAVVDVDGIPLPAGSSADGLAAYGIVYDFDTGQARECVVGVVAASEPGFTLSGFATLGSRVEPADQPISSTVRLSGDVTATPPLLATPPNGFSQEPTLTTTGTATKVIAVPAKTVKDKKSKAEKKAAKKKYESRLKSAKKTYATAWKKAGNSKIKKAAAKKKYAQARSSAKAKYTYAIANYKIVKPASTTSERRPFTLSQITL